MREKFDIVLDKNEEIIWCNNVNVSSFVKKNFLKTFLFGLFPPLAILMLGIPYTWLFLILGLLSIISLEFAIIHLIFSVISCVLFVILLNKSAKNTFFCITNKRIIKRSGTFTNDFVHYSLKNIGNVQVDGSIFDSQGNIPSSSLVITVKDYHTNTDGNTRPLVLKVNSLNNAYDAYKVINELTEGNNENLRIKVEK